MEDIVKSTKTIIISLSSGRHHSGKNYNSPPSGPAPFPAQNDPDSSNRVLRCWAGGGWEAFQAAHLGHLYIWILNQRDKDATGTSVFPTLSKSMQWWRCTTLLLLLLSTAPESWSIVSVSPHSHLPEEESSDLALWQQVRSLPQWWGPGGD